MAFRYYSIHRPVAPGTFPKSGVINLHNFDYRTSDNPLNRPAWGYIDYNRALTEKEMRDYELVFCAEIETAEETS